MVVPTCAPDYMWFLFSQEVAPLYLARVWCMDAFGIMLGCAFVGSCLISEGCCWSQWRFVLAAHGDCLVTARRLAALVVFYTPLLGASILSQTPQLLLLSFLLFGLCCCLLPLLLPLPLPLAGFLIFLSRSRLSFGCTPQRRRCLPTMQPIVVSSIA